MLASTHFEAPPGSGSLNLVVAYLADEQAILIDILFPHTCLCWIFWVWDDCPPTKFGWQALSWGKLAMVWDVPILSMDLFDESRGDLSVLERLPASPPAKVLELGTDQLLTSYFRGGGGVSTTPSGGKRDWNEPQVSLASTPEPKRAQEKAHESKQAREKENNASTQATNGLGSEEMGTCQDSNRP